MEPNFKNHCKPPWAQTLHLYLFPRRCTEIPCPCSIKEGLGGGEKAAHALQDEIRKQLKETYPDRDSGSWKIMAVVIASMDNLAHAYNRHLSFKEEYYGINFTASLRQFAVGFNRGARHTFSFVDVGGSKNLKELTDTKLKETFQMSRSCLSG